MLKSNNFCYHKIRRAITKCGVTEKSSILLSQYWKHFQFYRVPFCFLGAPIMILSVMEYIFITPSISFSRLRFGKIIIGAPKIIKDFWYPIKMLIFPILLSQYWTFFQCSPFSYCSSNFAIAKDVALNLFAYFFVPVLCIDSWLLFYLALHKVITLPSITTAICVTLVCFEE